MMGTTAFFWMKSMSKSYGFDVAVCQTIALYYVSAAKVFWGIPRSFYVGCASDYSNAGRDDRGLT
jgi:hypothetical protein